MKIQVDQITEDGKQIESTVEPSEMQFDMPGYRLDDVIAVTVTVTKSGDDVYVEGKLRGAIESECSRCLVLFRMPVDLDLNVVYAPEKEEIEGEAAIEEDANLAFYSGDTIDLLREIRDVILVNLPINPICRSDCRGLCPQCGADLNAGTCGCEQRTGPSPFDKLKELKSKLKE